MAKSDALERAVKSSKAGKALTQCGLQKCKAPMVAAVKAMALPKFAACKKGDKTACAVMKELKALLQEGKITSECYLRIFNKLST